MHCYTHTHTHTHTHTQKQKKKKKKKKKKNRKPMVIENIFFTFFYCKKMETNDPRDGAIVDREHC